MPKLRALMLLVPAFVLVGALPSVIAQDKAKGKSENYSQKVLVDNDRVRVTETTFKPGGEGPNIERPYRITRALKGGTLERNYPDGKKEKREWKTGQVREQGPDKQFVPKNVGKSEVVLYTVTPKQPKK
jgi:hypothetical protein